MYRNRFPGEQEVYCQLHQSFVSIIVYHTVSKLTMVTQQIVIHLYTIFESSIMKCIMDLKTLWHPINIYSEFKCSGVTVFVLIVMVQAMILTWPNMRCWTWSLLARWLPHPPRPNRSPLYLNLIPQLHSFPPLSPSRINPHPHLNPQRSPRRRRILPHLLHSSSDLRGVPLRYPCFRTCLAALGLCCD